MNVTRAMEKDTYDLHSFGSELASLKTKEAEKCCLATSWGRGELAVSGRQL